MPKSNSEFELFKKEFRKWQLKFGLMGYKVYFKFESCDNAFSDIQINLGDMVVTVRLNRNLPDEEKLFRDVKHSAKHEALHLLVGRLEQDGRFRYSSSNEILEATEELVHKLEDLI